MIIKGQSRARSRQLAEHLLRKEDNERIRLYETRGTVAQDVAGALKEMEAGAAAGKWKRPLYHASISPEIGKPLTDDQVRIAVDTLERKLGLTAQPRVVVLHRKAGRDHVHAVWSRIDTARSRIIPDSWNYRHHEEAARELETRFGHTPVKGAHGKGARRKRTCRTPEAYEFQQAARSGVPVTQISAELTALWNSSGSAAAFRRKLEEAGYTLARGDRRVFVVIDRAGEVHSLARRIDGARSADIRSRLAGVDLNSLPSVADVSHRKREEPARAEKSALFIPAGQEITRLAGTAHRVKRTAHPMPRTLLAARVTMREVVRADFATPVRPRPMRVALINGPALRIPRYRALRAALLAQFAARIADAERYAPREQLEYIIARITLERQAALDALAQVSRPANRKCRPTRRHTTGMGTLVMKLRRARRRSGRTSNRKKL